MTRLLTDVEHFRARARETMKTVSTAGSPIESQSVVSVLNQTLAMRLVCVLRYSRHCFDGQTQGSTTSAQWLGRAGEFADHVDRIAARIVQLGGVPEYNPDSLTSRRCTECNLSSDWSTMNQEYLAILCIVAASYAEVVSWLGDGDPTTRRMLEDLLVVEEQRTQSVLELLGQSS